MDQPTHEAGKCGKRGERWECLHAIDADHFWLGDLMVDLVQLENEQNRMSLLPKFTDAQIHGIGFNLGSLRLYARRLARGEEAKVEAVKHCLGRLNHHGLHTGYSK